MTGLATTRFAPSPTGALHLGHAYSALFAAARGARFVLRIEDIDPGRARAEHVAGIETDLAWLGLDWERPEWRQSARLHLYAAALEQLREAGLVYPCFCTRADVAASLAAPHVSRGPAPSALRAPPPEGEDLSSSPSWGGGERSEMEGAGPGGVYPGTCRRLSAGERARRMAAEPHAWRLDMGAAVARAGRLTWRDEAAGTQTAHPELHGDIVLARKDVPASYHLAVTIDDAAQGVTLVTRARDLFAATDAQRLLQALLGLPTPAYHHHPVLVGPDGARLAKRAGSPTLAGLRARGIDRRSLVRDLMALARRADGTIYVPRALLA